MISKATCVAFSLVLRYFLNHLAPHVSSEHSSGWDVDVLQISTPILGRRSPFFPRFTMSKHGLPFLGSEESSKFILSRFDFEKLLQVPRLPPPRPFPPNWLSLCPRFVKTRIESYAYDVGVPEILQFVFYCSVLQEVVRFNIIPAVVVQDLTKNSEEFN